MKKHCRFFGCKPYAPTNRIYQTGYITPQQKNGTDADIEMHPQTLRLS